MCVVGVKNIAPYSYNIKVEKCVCFVNAKLSNSMILSYVNGHVKLPHTFFTVR